MYQAGGRIAEQTGTSPSTVGYHLRAARAADPGLRTAHEKAAARKTTRVTYQGLERMKELIAAVQETGQYPSLYASDLSERTLAAWLNRRRREAHAGTLAPAYREGLSVLPAGRESPWPSSSSPDGRKG
jgi:DNA-binding transcriptional ArsR family regulator